MTDMFAFDYKNNGPGLGMIDLKRKDQRVIRLRRCLEAVEKQTGRVLEIGCGPGNFSRSLHRYRPDLKLFGCDISENAISAARMCNNDIEYIVANGQQLPFGNGEFSIVLVMDVLEHVEDPGRVIREAWRVLGRGGIFHACVPCEKNRLTLWWLLSRIKFGQNLTKRHLGHIQPLTTARLNELLAKNGFVNIRYSFSQHWFSQLMLLIWFFMPKELLQRVFGKKVVDRCRDCVIFSNDDSENRGYNMKFLYMLRRIWLSITELIAPLTYYEGELMKYIGATATDVHVTCERSARVAK